VREREQLSFSQTYVITPVGVHDVNMLVFEAKLEGKDEQYQALDEAIRTARFVRNASLRYWMDNKDFSVKTARCVVRSNDLVAYVSEAGRSQRTDLQVRNMVKNHRLAKSISDVSWSLFREWVEYFGKVFGVVTVAVPPHYTSQNCSNCGEAVKKTLSTRTHVCPHCGHTQDRDWNAARNILEKGLSTAGHVGTTNASGETDQYLGGETPSSKSTRGKRKPKERSLESPAISGTRV
jgi:putative transposase